jgi:ubiquinol-cytochrome c reductase subunit 8
MKNMFRDYIFNGYRRLSKQFVYWAIPFSIGLSFFLMTLGGLCANGRVTTAYATYSYGKSRYAYLNSKAGHIATGGHH